MVTVAVRYTYGMSVYKPSSYKSKLLYSRHLPGRSYKIVILIMLVLLFVGAMAYGLYYLAKLPYWQITHISVSGTRSLQESKVRSAVEEYMNGSFLYIIPKTNYFFVRASSVGGVLLSKFPRILTVSVQKKFPSSLDISLTERDIWALYCNDSLYAKEKSAGIRPAVASSTLLVVPELKQKPVHSCFYIDETGDVVDSALEYQGSLLTIFFERRSENPKLGERVLSDADILFFRSSREEYKKNIGAEIVSFEKTDALLDDYILFTQEGWYVLVPRSADISLSVKGIKTLLDAVIKGDRGRLAYIDARFGNKMFYKLRSR